MNDEGFFLRQSIKGPKMNLEEKITAMQLEVARSQSELLVAKQNLEDLLRERKRTPYKEWRETQSWTDVDSWNASLEWVIEQVDKYPEGSPLLDRIILTIRKGIEPR